MAKFNNSISEEYKSKETTILECGMYLSCLLSEDELEKLKEDWEDVGGYEIVPFAKFVFDNVKVSYT